MAVDCLASSTGLSVSPRVFLFKNVTAACRAFSLNACCFFLLLLLLFWVLFLARFQILHPLLIRIQVHSRFPLCVLFFYIFRGRNFFVGSNFFAVQKIVHAVAAVDLSNFFSAAQYMPLVLYFQQLFYGSSAWQKEVFFCI